MPMNPGDLGGKIEQLIKLFKTAPGKAEVTAGWDKSAKQMAARHLEALRKSVAEGKTPPPDILPALRQKGVSGPLLGLLGDIHERVESQRAKKK